MSNDRVNLDEVPTGNNAPPSSDFPLPSLRKFMLPDQLVLVRSFEAASLPELDKLVNAWVIETCAVIAIPSSISRVTDESGTYYLLTVTHIRAADGNENVKA
jgi:hypothetical protein